MSETATSVRKRGWASAALAIAFGLLFVYDLFEAVSNLVGVPAQLAEYNVFLIENDITPQPVPWAVLVANVLLPVVAYAVAWMLGHRRGILYQALFFVLGLAVVAALTLTFTSLV